MLNRLPVPMSCFQCRYGPFGNACKTGSCDTCKIGKGRFCKCVSMPNGSICPYAEYSREETCPVCGERYTFIEDNNGNRLSEYNYSVKLTILNNPKNGNIPRLRVCDRYICPTCGEQLKKCMEEKPK